MNFLRPEVFFGLRFWRHLTGGAALAVLLCLLAPGLVRGQTLDERFVHPPEATRPRCYWYWMDNRVSKEGITKDLEAMRDVGIGEAYIGIIGGTSGLAPITQPRALTDEWWSYVEHAIREGGRLGVDIGFFNSPGWSQSGGPWVKASQSMRYVALPELHLHGPQKFSGKLPAPVGEFQDLAVLAFPAPVGEFELAPVALRTATNILFTSSAPFTARSLVVTPINKINVQAELQASEDGFNYHSVKTFVLNRENLAVNVGPVPLAPEIATFPAVTARYFRLQFSGPCSVGEVHLSPAVREESYAEKSLLKMFPQPHPPYDYYTWPPQAGPTASALVVTPDSVRNLTKLMDSAAGTLRWTVPAGDWIVERAVLVPTGTSNSPAPPEATGREVDKMNRAALKAHFDAYVGELLRRLPASERTAWKHVVADSYEQGSENWTDGFAGDFQKRYGYDPLPWLPVMSGRVVGSPDQSDRFLWDLRRLVADRIARDYVGGLRDLCHQSGLRMWLENYGHWGFPAEFLQYGGACDEIAGEFWANGNYDDEKDFNYLGRIELADAASAAHIYNMRQVWSEAYTGGPAFVNAPHDLKARGDWALSEGINQFMLHVYIHQPWEDKVPGINAWFGTEFNRHNTWFRASKPWFDYLRRCSVMLQAGQPVADIAYFISEDTPKMAGRREPAPPVGRDFDYVNAEVIEKSFSVQNGRLALPFGLSYRVLVLPEQVTMRPELLRKIRDLVKAGAVVVGKPPERSPSMERFPACDAEVQRLAHQIWGQADGSRPGEHAFGRGRVIWGKSLEEVFAGLESVPDFASSTRLRFKHRQDGETDIYFVANPDPKSVVAQVAFRVTGRAPEIWWPDSGRHELPAVFAETNGMTRLPIELGPSGSLFVVFRKSATGTPQVVSIRQDGKEILGVNRAADPAAFATLTTNTPLRLELSEAGELNAEVTAAGKYDLEYADGHTREMTVPTVPALLPLEGPWQVDFASGGGAPASTQFPQLVSWTHRPEPGIKYFSGEAVYRKSFVFPPESLTPATTVILDLGEVRDLAKVRVNGREQVTLWNAPWRADLTSALHPGTNLLEIAVINTWNNRLVGDAKLPVAKRHTFLSTSSITPSTRLRPAGLIGPVYLQTVLHLPVK